MIRLQGFLAKSGCEPSRPSSRPGLSLFFRSCFSFRFVPFRSIVTIQL